MLTIEWRYYEGYSLSTVKASYPAEDGAAVKQIELAAAEPGRIAAVIRDGVRFDQLHTIFARAYLKDSRVANFQATKRWRTIVVWFNPTIKEIAVAQAILDEYCS